MGSVLSRCTQEVSSVLRNCLSKEGRSEKESYVLSESQEQHAELLEDYLLQSDANKIGKEDRAQVPANEKLSDCEQSACYSEGHSCGPAGAGLHSTICTGNCDRGADNTTKASALSKEYIRRTYKLTPSNSHAGTANMNSDTATSTSETCFAVVGADKVKVTERGEGNTEAPVDDRQQMWKDNGSRGIAQTGGEEQVPERIRKLEQRQTKVLQDLNKLQEQVLSMAQQRCVDLSAVGELSTQARGVTGVPSQTHASPLQSGKLLDLVVSVDPDTVPLSLLVLLSQLSSQYHILTTTYVHSSATTTPDRLRNFLQNGAHTSPRSNFQIALSVVWKKVPNGPRLMVSPTQQTHIEGEVNVARYLGRLLQPAYDGSSIVQATQIDEILDTVQQQLIRGNKERAAVLRTLNAWLGKSQFVVGSSLSLADVVVWSAVQGLHLASDAPTNVKQWLKACRQSKEFQTAVQFMSS